jgi:hypothetical protein
MTPAARTIVKYRFKIAHDCIPLLCTDKARRDHFVRARDRSQRHQARVAAAPWRSVFHREGAKSAKRDHSAGYQYHAKSGFR